MGGWDGSSYNLTMTTGDNAPVVIPGDIEESLLAMKMSGTHETGTVMPPEGKLPDSQVQIIVDWIESGAIENYFVTLFCDTMYNSKLQMGYSTHW